MLIIKSTYGKFRIPDTVEYSIYTANCHTVYHSLPDSGEKAAFEYGNLIFETPHMRCTFRQMRDPGNFYSENLEDLYDSETIAVIYIDAFDPLWGYDSLEIQMK